MKWNILYLSLIVFSAGCGHTSGPTQPSGSQPAAKADQSSALPAVKRDPCSLLTKEEIGTAVGAEMGDPHSDDGMHCMYSGPATPATGAAVTAAWGPDNVKMLFTDGKRLLKERSSTNLFQDITGIGDEAFYVPGAGLSVRKGDAFFSIGLTTLASAEATATGHRSGQIDADFLEKEKELAVKALAKL